MLLAFLIAAAVAAPSHHGWRPVAPSDVASGPDAEFRRGHPTAYLAATGDFDGDRKPDQARMVSNARLFGVIVRLSSRSGAKQLVAWGPRRHLTRIGISTAPPGRYATDCGKRIARGRRPLGGRCPIRELRLQADSLHLFTFESAARVLWYADGRWNETWVTD